MCASGRHRPKGLLSPPEDLTRTRSSRCLSAVQVKAHAYVRETIIGWESSVGCWARTDAITVLGEDVKVKDEVCLVGVKVLPHKSLKENLYAPTIVM